DALKKEFNYVFSDQSYPGIPQIHIHEIRNEKFTILENVDILPVRVMHFRLPVMGFRIGDFTYITDAKTVDPQEVEKIKGTKVLVINALQREKHISHFTLEEAIRSEERRVGKELGIR